MKGVTVLSKWYKNQSSWGCCRKREIIVCILTKTCPVSTAGGQKGVDSSESSDNALMPAQALASECHCVVVVTGEHDFVTDGTRVIKVSNGHPVLKMITAAGCTLTAVIAAFVCLEDPTDVNLVMKGCACALSVFGIAAELAVKNPACKGPGSARMHMLDAYSGITIETLWNMAKFS